MAPRALTRIPGLRATFFLDDEEQHEGRPLVEVVLELAWEAGVCTAIATRGAAGFGRRHVIQTVGIEVLAHRLPITIECIGERERVQRFVERLAALPIGGILEVQPTTLVVPAEPGSAAGGA